MSGTRSNWSKVVLLGHSGFIGRNLWAYLEARGYALVGGSLSRHDFTDLSEMLQFSSCFDEETAVVLLAGIKREVDESLEAFEKNIRIAANVARAVSRRPVGRLLFFSSTAVYGEEAHNTTISEQSAVNPQSYYGLAKFASERILLRAAEADGLGSRVVARPPHIYGPGEPAGNYGPGGFLRAAMAGQPITLWGDGSERREFLYVGDTVQLAERLLNSSFEGAVNLVSGVSRSFRDALEVVESVLGTKPELRRRERTKEQVDHGFENGLLAKVVPGFEFTSLEAGVRRTHETLRTAAPITQ